MNARFSTASGALRFRKARPQDVPTGKADMTKVFFALCKSVDSPVSLGAWLRFKYGEHLSLAGMSVNAKWYDDAYRFHMDYTVVEFLSKYKGLITGIDTESAALERFIAAETSCREANHRIRSWLSGEVYPPSGVGSVLHTAARKIAKIFDRCFVNGVFDASPLQEGCRWGPGATFSLKGEEANLDNKIREDQFSVTSGALPYLWQLLMDDAHWLEARGYHADGPFCPLVSSFSLTNGGRLTTVPKNAKTDRTIHIEPSGNIFLQLGVGQYIRRELRRVGIDLDDQSINQTWASLAYTLGLATVDLSAASDTICRELVYLLLPPDIAYYLDDLRSPMYLIEDRWYGFQKWSSMGNGYTFELETLIFWAIASSIAEAEKLLPVVAVYGDDIILDARGVPSLIETFDFLGFAVNSKKTFADGPFFESCGKHYFRGIDVTPIYQKEVPDVLEEVYRLANRLRRLAYRMGAVGRADPTLRSVWLASCQCFSVRGVLDPPHFAPFTSIPTSLVYHKGDWVEDDGALLLDSSEFPRDTRRSEMGGGYFAFRVYAFIPKGKKLDTHTALYAYHLRRNGHTMTDRNPRPRTPFDGTVSIRGRGRYAEVWRNLRIGGDAAWLS